MSDHDSSEGGFNVAAFLHETQPEHLKVSWCDMDAHSSSCRVLASKCPSSDGSLYDRCSHCLPSCATYQRLHVLERQQLHQPSACDARANPRPQVPAHDYWQVLEDCLSTCSALHQTCNSSLACKSRQALKVSFWVLLNIGRTRYKHVAQPALAGKICPSIVTCI